MLDTFFKRSGFFEVVCFHLLSILSIVIACIAWMGRNNTLLKTFLYPTVTVAHFTDQNWISKNVNCIRCVMTCKVYSYSKFPEKTEKTRKSKAFSYQANTKHFCVYLWSLLTMLNISVRGPTSTIVFYCLFSF